MLLVVCLLLALSGASLLHRSLEAREAALASGLPRLLAVGVVAALLGGVAAWSLRARLVAERGARAHAEGDVLDAGDVLRHTEHLATVGKLASGVAHELGTPLHVVIARAKRIVKRRPDDETLQEAEGIVHEAERMSRLIRQLVDFAHPRQPRLSRVELHALARATTATLRPMAAARQVRLELAGGDEDNVEGDPEALAQMLTNLVMNGIQASAPGRAVTVTVCAPVPMRRHGAARTYARVAVSDEGVGIPEAVRQHIFEPFFTTREVGEGTGLGLSVAWGIAREHGGFIDVWSEPGAGSRFTVHLPLPEREATREHAGVA